MESNPTVQPIQTQPIQTNNSPIEQKKSKKKKNFGLCNQELLKLVGRNNI